MPKLLRAWLELRWREVGEMLPQRPIEGLLPVARALFPDPEAFSAWTQGIAGIGPEECEFRMSIPVSVYRAAASYNAVALEEILQGLMRLSGPYEIVSKYADAEQMLGQLAAELTAESKARLVGLVRDRKRAAGGNHLIRAKSGDIFNRAELAKE